MAYLLNRQTAREVHSVFTQIQKNLGKEKFIQLFPVLLTGRDSEFINPKTIEYCGEEQWKHVFFCDTQKPLQKNHVENATSS